MLLYVFLFVVAVAAAFLVWYTTCDADVILLVCHKLFHGRKRRLQGMCVWITGASSGIGEWTAYELASLGAKLILSARRVKELERVKKSCITQWGSTDDSVKILQLDIQDVESHSQVVSEALKCFDGHIDILINNAGRSQRALIANTELGVDRELLETNTLGTISLTKAILPSMMERKSGHIAFISSMAGKLGVPVSASYVASKHALQGWFNTLRMEMMSENIDVSIVCPGPVVSQGAANAILNTVGSVVGPTNVDDSGKMTTERCAKMIVTAVASRLDETWVSTNPGLFFCYVSQYCPMLASLLARIAVPSRIAAFKAGNKDINATIQIGGFFKRQTKID
eukprot:m.80404 g.80404  ORF g.80404 m.80404 type:complete len:341 (+) comp36191_c0_seq3:67-1089(+)